jgi:hypothetical protein
LVGAAIWINASNVTLDLNGHVLNSIVGNRVTAFYCGICARQGTDADPRQRRTLRLIPAILF